jgi:membrane associated rhomboid family serine protease
MLLPYNVDRITRHVPWVTYALMGANVFVFLMTLLISNVSLSSDRLEGQQVITTLTQGTSLPDLGQGALVQPEDLNAETLKNVRQYQAMIAVSKNLQTPDDIKRQYLVLHAYDSFVESPRYSILNAFAYRPNEPSALQKIFSMFTAMFLHSGFDHLLGNMLFLWVFGRAIEEFLGRRFFLMTYLTSGVAATLMQHIMTQYFTPTAMGVPNLGASGAIAGVLGLFAVRFYRTKVRVFYLWGWAMWAFLLIFLIVAAIVGSILGEPTVSALIGLIVAGGALLTLGRGNTWGAFHIPSIWVIGVWVVFLNLAPALYEIIVGDQGSVAYWAHIGGFICGAFYALAIGGVDEGKAEYALEDAKTALQTSGSEDAIRRANDLLQKDAANPAAHEVAAQGYDRRKNVELAAHHYILAIEGYWKSNQRDAATRLYGIALELHPQLKLKAALLLSLSSHFAQNAMWNDSAVALNRLVEEYGNTPEAEIALLRAASLWMKQFNQPQEALRMTQMFRDLYPNSQWEAQAQGIESNAKDMMTRGG